MASRLNVRLARILAALGLLRPARWLKRQLVRLGGAVGRGVGALAVATWRRGVAASTRVARRVRRWRARKILADAGPDRVVVYHEDHWCAADIGGAMRQIDAMESNTAYLAGILDELRVPYAYIPSLSTHRLRIAVPASERRKVLSRLASSPDPGLHLRSAGNRPWLGIPVVRRPPAIRLRRSPEIRVYRARADASGSLVYGSLVGCSLEFWREGSDGMLATVLGDTRMATAARKEFGAATVDLTTIRVRTLPIVAEKTLFSVQSFPVDLVYTWVDGSDPEWRKRKNEVATHLHTDSLTVDSDVPERFVHRDELRFSLRSVSQFAEFVRHVYLVTDRQVPEWLDTACSRLTVVDHRDIFGDSGALPTFNSHAIESRLHHIPGLAEHFVYMNDDFLFGRRVLHTNFFHPNGIAKFFMSHAVLAGESLSVDHAAHNAADLLEQEFGIRVTNKMKHAPYALRRSALEAMEARFPGAFAATAKHQLRSPDDLPVASSMGHYFGAFTGVAVPGTIVNAYVDIGRPGFDEMLQRILTSRRYDVICLNDTTSGLVDADDRDAVVRRWLDTYFPVPGEFERA